MSLDHLLQRADIWRGGEDSPHGNGTTIPTGRRELDQALGGWPLGALTELLLDRQGIGEISLLLPALAELGKQRWIAWIDPPHVPYAPALAAAGIDLQRLLWIHPTDPKDAMWALEQSLRSGACGAVLGWPRQPDNRALRRLQLAAEESTALAVLFRPVAAGRQPSPAALRLRLEESEDGVTLQVLKRRGGVRNRVLRVMH